MRELRRGKRSLTHQDLWVSSGKREGTLAGPIYFWRKRSRFPCCLRKMPNYYEDKQTIKHYCHGTLQDPYRTSAGTVRNGVQSTKILQKVCNISPPQQQLLIKGYKKAALPVGWVAGRISELTKFIPSQLELLVDLNDKEKTRQKKLIG